ncbi:hypothetical protein PGT21_012962 [Puccinia graminis f. sp. tritici]|uniref:Uncharacterized protein n=1 Tax=Puccinia graminis f. sp. tritici TaxID=56615 RepID=A0A5B0QAM9_PUCGR|nr:hypothetical protein PGT21_012962 [Puccinia graminis f. sp. tritici]
MSDSEILDDVTWELDGLACQFMDALRAGATVRPAANDLMIDELTGRNELIDELESSLLPAIKDHINSLLLALDLQNSGEQPNPDLDLILEIVPKFHETLTKTTSSVESVSAPFEGVCTNERNLGRCKDFRSRLLRSAVACIITMDLCPLFSSCIDVIETCQLSRKHPKNLEHRAKRSEWIKETREMANDTISYLDSIIETSKKTDLAILQDKFWSERWVNIALKELAELVDPNRIDLKHEGVSIDELKIISTRREHILEVARLAIPIVKLTRVFLVKIRNSAPEKPSFILDPEIDSNSLQLLSEAPNTISGRLANLASFLTSLYKEDWGYDLNRNLFSNSLRELPLLLDSILVLLCRYLIPVPAAVDHHSSSQNDFKVWFLDLQSLYLKTTERLLNALQCSCHPYGE